MKSYIVLESCHYQGVTYRKGQTAILPQDPRWPERFQAVTGETADAVTEAENETKTETKTGAAKAPAKK